MPPKPSEKKANQLPKAKSKNTRKRTSERYDSLKPYIYRILKHEQPDMGISSQAMIIMNNFMFDIFERIAEESSNLVKLNKRSTITSGEIQTAARLILPGELGKRAVMQGTKAMTVYASSK